MVLPTLTIFATGRMGYAGGNLWVRGDKNLRSFHGTAMSRILVASFGGEALLGSRARLHFGWLVH